MRVAHSCLDRVLLLGSALLLAPVSMALAQPQVPVQLPPRPPSSGLTGVTWRVQQYGDGAGGLTSVVAGTQITMVFGDDGTVSGDTGCNSYRGPHQIGATTLTFGPLITTRRACVDEAANAQEHLFLASMEAAATYQRVGDRMTVFDASAQPLLVLVRPTVEPGP